MRRLDKMEVKPFSKRYLDFFLVNLSLMKQHLKEYKVNFYSAISVLVFYTSFTYFFLFVISNSFGDVIGWSYFDFILYSIYTRIIHQTSGIFTWGKNISHSLLHGEFNQHLVRPLNIMPKYFFSNLTSVGFTYFISSLIELSIILIYFNHSISFYVIFVLFILSLIEFLFFEVVESFGFYGKKLDHEIKKFLRPFYNILHRFPFNYFKAFSLKNIFLLFSSVLVVLLLFPHEFSFSIIFLWSFILLYLLTLVCILLFNWHYGLKKYEAFG
jgi:ABC-type uncharacterized transport system permease subunit